MRSTPLVRTLQALLVIAIAAVVPATLSACAGMSRQNQSTAVGAGAGAVAGAVLTGGSAAGTVAGAAVGGIIGHEAGEEKK